MFIEFNTKLKWLSHLSRLTLILNSAIVLLWWNDCSVSGVQYGTCDLVKLMKIFRFLSHCKPQCILLEFYTN